MAYKKLITRKFDEVQAWLNDLKDHKIVFFQLHRQHFHVMIDDKSNGKE